MFVFCLFVPYPHGYKVSCGGSGYCALDQSFYAKSEIDCFTIAYSSLRKYKSILWDFFASVCKQPPNANRSVGFLAHKLSHTTKTAHHLDALFCWWGQQGSSTAKRKCLHFEASVQCDRGTGAQGFAQRRRNRLIRARCCFPTQKKSTTHNVARFLMWWGQQGSNL